MEIDGLAGGIIGKKEDVCNESNNAITMIMVITFAFERTTNRYK